MALPAPRASNGRSGAIAAGRDTGPFYRYIILVDAGSTAMGRRKEAAAQTVGELIYSGFEGQAQPGDTFRDLDLSGHGRRQSVYPAQRLDSRTIARSWLGNAVKHLTGLQAPQALGSRRRGGGDGPRHKSLQGSDAVPRLRRDVKSFTARPTIWISPRPTCSTARNSPGRQSSRSSPSIAAQRRPHAGLGGGGGRRQSDRAEDSGEKTRRRRWPPIRPLPHRNPKLPPLPRKQTRAPSLQTSPRENRFHPPIADRPRTQTETLPTPKKKSPPTPRPVAAVVKSSPPPAKIDAPDPVPTLDRTTPPQKPVEITPTSREQQHESRESAVRQTDRTARPLAASPRHGSHHFEVRQARAFEPRRAPRPPPKETSGPPSPTANTNSAGATTANNTPPKPTIDIPPAAANASGSAPPPTPASPAQTGMILPPDEPASPARYLFLGLALLAVAGIMVFVALRRGRSQSGASLISQSLDREQN